LGFKGTKMNIIDVLTKSTINVDLKAKNKIEVLEELSGPISEISNVDQKELVRVLIEREQLGSTGIGGGIGIPHGKLKHLNKLVLGFGLSREGVDFDSIDGRPTHIFFLLVTPENSAGDHLKLLAHIARLLRNEVFKEKLMNVENADDLIRIIQKEDRNEL